MVMEPNILTSDRLKPTKKHKSFSITMGNIVHSCVLSGKYVTHMCGND